jgi:hypothetical protein
LVVRRSYSPFIGGTGLEGKAKGVTIVSDSTIPVWLSLIAIASLLQVTMLIVAVVIVAKSARQMQRLATEIRRDQIAPIVARAHNAIDEVQDVVARVRTYDDDLRRAVGRAGDRVNQVSDLMRTGSWPLIGLVRGASAAFSVLVNGRHHGRANGAGGTDHAR